MKGAIGIMCKAPRVGISKTRLIPVLGAELSARLSRAFLIDLAASINAIAAPSHAYGTTVYAPSDGEAELRTILPETFAFLCMAGSSFGTALSDATETLLERDHDCVLLVNGDSPTLPPDLFEEAIAHLRRPGERVVFGPALDGGYYLIGCKSSHPRLFEEIAWSTASVLAQSLDRAKEIGVESVLLEPWYDVDDAESLKMLCMELDGHVPPGLARLGGPAIETRAVLNAANIVSDRG